MATLQEIGGDFALIGGLALASHKVIRATQDIDLLADADVADRVDAAVTRLGIAVYTAATANLTKCSTI